VPLRNTLSPAIPCPSIGFNIILLIVSENISDLPVEKSMLSLKRR
jgi:hypothetical protein